MFLCVGNVKKKKEKKLEMANKMLVFVKELPPVIKVSEVNVAGSISFVFVFPYFTEGKKKRKKVKAAYKYNTILRFF